MKRSGKFYRNNEAEVMQLLGLQETANSGSGWIEKEDGQSDEIICQLKSTDANSIKVNKKDIDTLEYNAMVAHKLPLFVIQFLQSNESYLIISPRMLKDVAKYLDTGKYIEHESMDLGVNLVNAENTYIKPKMVKSSSKSRNQFNKENEKKFKKERKSAL